VVTTAASQASHKVIEAVNFTCQALSRLGGWTPNTRSAQTSLPSFMSAILSRRHLSRPLVSRRGLSDLRCVFNVPSVVLLPRTHPLCRSVCDIGFINEEVVEFIEYLLPLDLSRYPTLNVVHPSPVARSRPHWHVAARRRQAWRNLTRTLGVPARAFHRTRPCSRMRINSFEPISSSSRRRPWRPASHRRGTRNSA
jgi:hypothetical protein